MCLRIIKFSSRNRTWFIRRDFFFFYQSTLLPISTRPRRGPVEGATGLGTASRISIPMSFCSWNGMFRFSVSDDARRNAFAIASQVSSPLMTLVILAPKGGVLWGTGVASRRAKVVANSRRIVTVGFMVAVKLRWRYE